MKLPFGLTLVAVIALVIAGCGSDDDEEFTPTASLPISATVTASSNPTVPPWPHLRLTTSRGAQEGQLGSRTNELGSVDAGYVPLQAVESLGSESVQFAFDEAVTPLEMGLGISKVDPQHVEDVHDDLVLYLADSLEFVRYDSVPPRLNAEYQLDLPPGEYKVVMDAKLSTEPFRHASWGFHVRVVES
ncbi:MAG TPA: hypothetical protein VMT90_01445 [Dehalococcoidia bacterium]|jgi:hypothetical protein|nr:hypothetical protein [Dehalococcoidia bacterium]